MQRAHILFAVRMTVVEDNRRIASRAHLKVEPGESCPATPLVRDSVEVHEHRHVPMAVVQVLFKVACLRADKARPREVSSGMK